MHFICSKCNGIIEVDDSERGNPVGCGHCGKFVVVPEKLIATNVVLNNDFILKEKLGQGGVGTVYHAYQISLDRPVALKILMEQFAQDKNFVEDFIREARAAARLNHPNIVQSFAVGQDHGVFFCAMELVEGETLKHIIGREGKVSIEFSLQIMRQMAEALDFAWKNQKLVHRDIKPDNIMLTSGGVAKLADLGLARVASETEEESEEIMGTPQYISPEQLIGSKTDVRTDIYSLGATWYHAITGAFPFDGDSPQEIARKHLEDTLIPPNEVNPAVPKTISVMISKMMAKHPDDRYHDAEELIEDIKLAANTPGAKNSAKRKAKGKTFTASIKVPTRTGKVKTITTRTGSLKLSTSTTRTKSLKVTTASRKLTADGTTDTPSVKLNRENINDVDQTVQMQPADIESTQPAESKKNPMIFIAVGLILIIIAVIAFLPNNTEKKVKDLITKGLKPDVAQQVVTFMKSIESNKYSAKNYKEVLAQYKPFQKNVGDYHKYLDAKLAKLLDECTELEVRELRKPLLNK